MEIYSNVASETGAWFATCRPLPSVGAARWDGYCRSVRTTLAFAQLGLLPDDPVWLNELFPEGMAPGLGEKAALCRLAEGFLSVVPDLATCAFFGRVVTQHPGLVGILAGLIDDRVTAGGAAVIIRGQGWLLARAMDRSRTASIPQSLLSPPQFAADPGVRSRALDSDDGRILAPLMVAALMQQGRCLEGRRIIDLSTDPAARAACSAAIVEAWPTTDWLAFLKGFSLTWNHKKGDVRFPVWLGIETFRGCDARCVMCPITTTKRVTGTMADATLDRILQEIRLWPAVPSIAPFGLGEPLQDRNLARRIARLKAAGAPFARLCTNAALLDRENGVALLKSGLDILDISLECIDRESFERIRVGLSFDRVLENILGFIKLRNAIKPECVVRLQVLAQPETVRHLAESLAFFQGHLRAGHDFVVFSARHGFGWNTSGPRTGLAPCTMLESSMNILMDGTVSVCWMDTEAEVRLGNIHDAPLLEIFNSELACRYRQHLKDRRHELHLCSGCNAPDLQANIILVQYPQDDGQIAAAVSRVDAMIRANTREGA